MNEQGTLGAPLPLWIIGAPFLAALIRLFKTPKPNLRDPREVDKPSDRRPGYADPMGPSAVAPSRF